MLHSFMQGVDLDLFEYTHTQNHTQTSLQILAQGFDTKQKYKSYPRGENEVVRMSRICS